MDQNHFAELLMKKTIVDSKDKEFIIQIINAKLDLILLLIAIEKCQKVKIIMKMSL